MESTAQPQSHTVVFVLGPPGSGKGTLCKEAVKRLGTPDRLLFHLSVGDYLRQISRQQASDEVESSHHGIVRQYLRDTKLLPASELIPLLKHKMDKTPMEARANAIWLIDGFPRNMETALAFEEKMGKPASVIVLCCSPDTAAARFLKRGREAADDKKRFDKRYGEYEEYRDAICEHYENIKHVVDAEEGGLEDSLRGFLEALRKTSQRLKNK
ncbi:P-loop containing nucleoside triphosphate hydrolase protein [Xylaria palmicola]|nr:P-loop containing nucleoside triphosphate hydrolase protein [Xylaria palmicola]